jgi:prepilin-type N-terminal cleavage/methylation domain-containing protein
MKKQSSNMCIQNSAAPQIKKLKGFTLIELIVAVLIIGIIFAAGVPGLQSLLGNVSLNASADKLESSLTYARGEAVARVTGVAVATIGSPVTSWNVYLEASTACGFTAGEEILRVVDITADNIDITGATCVLFNELGEADAAANFSVDSTAASATAATVSVFANGSVRVN